MSRHKSDLEYMNIIGSYLSSEKVQNLKNIGHHGTTRFEHSLKVSYYTYKAAKAMHLDYKEAAIGGLLHDFFETTDNISNKEKIESVFNHPKVACLNAKEEFDLTDKELDMIKSHMFPIGLSIPKYMESWVVSVVDKAVAAEEFSVKFKFKLRYAYNLLVLFIIGILK